MTMMSMKSWIFCLAPSFLVEEDREMMLTMTTTTTTWIFWPPPPSFIARPRRRNNLKRFPRSPFEALLCDSCVFEGEEDEEGD